MTSNGSRDPRHVVEQMAARIAQVDGVVGVVLGGSRARGTHRPDSDWDLGVYYRGRLDVAALRELAGPGVEVTDPGGWGPWVDGGAWLHVDGVAIDWIWRDLDRVAGVIADCQEGRYDVGMQVGHPLGFWSPAYMGELAVAEVLEDPTGAVAALKQQAATYPEPLRAALVERTWEAEFSIVNGAKGVARADTLYVSLCLSRAVGILVQALLAADRQWCVNEKDALRAAAATAAAPAGWGERAQRLLGGLGTTPEQLAAATDAALALLAETRAALGSESS